jgi:hypothetical protein
MAVYGGGRRQAIRRERSYHRIHLFGDEASRDFDGAVTRCLVISE